MATVSTDPVREWILTEGKASQITGISPVGGGCINLANRYTTDAGSFFVKTNRLLLKLTCVKDFLLCWLPLIALASLRVILSFHLQRCS